MSTPLAPEERAFWRKRTGLPGEVLMAQVVARLLAERDSLERERDEAREQVRSLTEQLAAAQGLLAARDDMSAMEARVAELRRAWDATGQADAGWCRESAVAGGDLFGSSAAYAKAWRDLVEAVNSICRAVEGPHGGTTP